MKNFDFKFKSYLKYLPWALIFYGLFYEVVYYRLFGFNVIGYLSFAEIFTSFMNIIVALLTFVILIVFIVDILKLFGTVGKIILITLFIGAGTTFILLYDKYIHYVYYIFGAILIMGSAYYLFFVLKESVEAEQKDKTILSRVFLFTLIFIVSLSLNRFYKTSRHYTFGTEIITVQDTLRSDSSIIFIGDLQNFVFLYDLDNNSNIIIPRSEIIQVKLNYNENFPGHFANIYFDPQRQLNEMRRIVAKD